MFKLFLSKKYWVISGSVVTHTSKAICLLFDHFFFGLFYTKVSSHQLFYVFLTVGLLLQHSCVRLHKARAARVLCGVLGHQKQ